MKSVIVLFAVMAVASAYPGVIPWAAPVAQPWPAPEPWQAPVVKVAAQPAYVKVAAQPSYVKVAPQPAYVKVAVPQVHAPEVHHAIQIPQQAAIPPPHPQPLSIKVPNVGASRIPYHGSAIVQPHLIGVEQYVEPIVKVVPVKSAPIPVHQPWD